MHDDPARISRRLSGKSYARIDVSHLPVTVLHERSLSCGGWKSWNHFSFLTG